MSITEIYLTDYTNNDGDDRGQILDLNDSVNFVTGTGDKYSITRNPDAPGIIVRMVRKNGFDQMSIHPRMANEIHIS